MKPAGPRGATWLNGGADADPETPTHATDQPGRCADRVSTPQCASSPWMRSPPGHGSAATMSAHSCLRGPADWPARPLKQGPLAHLAHLTPSWIHAGSTNIPPTAYSLFPPRPRRTRAASPPQTRSPEAAGGPGGTPASLSRTRRTHIRCWAPCIRAPACVRVCVCSFVLFVRAWWCVLVGWGCSRRACFRGRLASFSGRRQRRSPRLRHAWGASRLPSGE